MLSHASEYLDPEALGELLSDAWEVVKRNKKKTIGWTLAGISSVVAADTARVIVSAPDPPPIVRAEPPPQSQFQFVSTGERPLPSPDTPLPQLFWELRDNDRAQAFLQEHTECTQPTNPIEFTSTYRVSVEDFLQNGGPCNNYADFWCHVWAANGKTPYLLSMRPGTGHKNQHRLAGDSIKSKKGWHMVAVYRRQNQETNQSEYVIASNGSYKVWQGTLESYASSEGMIILPLGGIRAWQPVAGDASFRAKIWENHAGPNVQHLQYSEEVSTLPPSYNPAATTPAVASVDKP